MTQNALLITSSTSSPPADAVWIHDRLVSQGWTVTYALRTASSYTFTGLNLVITDATVDASGTGTKLDAAPCGVLGMYSGPHSKFAGATNPAGGTASNSVYVLPAANGDAIVGANTGTITISTAGAPVAPQYYLTGVLGSGSVASIVTSSSQLTRSIAGRYEAGAVMSDGVTTAPSRRIRLGFPAGFANLNATGTGIFDNAVTWAAAGDLAPTSNAGPDQSVAPGATVTLNGTGSSDPDAGDTITYAWSQTSGTTVTLSSSTAASPTFTAPADVNGATLVFSLTVTDSHAVPSPADTVQVSVTPAPFLYRRESGAWVRRKLYRRVSGAWVWP